MSMTDPAAGYRQFFAQGVTDFVQALKKKYKKDANLQEKANEFEILITNCPSPEIKDKLIEKMIKNWHKTLSPYYESLASGKWEDIYKIDHDLFNNLRLKEKFRAAKVKTRKVIMEHVTKINTFAQMSFATEASVKALPSSILNKVQNLSQKIISGAKSDQIDIGQIIMESQNMLANCTPEEQAQLEAAGKGMNTQAIMKNILNFGGNI